MLSMKGCYSVYDEAGNSLFYIESTKLFQLKDSFTVYQDKQKKIKLLTIKQDKFFQLSPSYSVLDENDRIIGSARKRPFLLFRSVWDISYADKKKILRAEEDISKAVLLSVFMPKEQKELANFNFIKDEEEIGEFNRRNTFLDKYVLDLSGDVGRSLDRRLALGMCIILDKGEGR